jgi:hypothetical protein
MPGLKIVIISSIFRVDITLDLSLVSSFRNPALSFRTLPLRSFYGKTSKTQTKNRHFFRRWRLIGNLCDNPLAVTSLAIVLNKIVFGCHHIYVYKYSWNLKRVNKFLIFLSFFRKWRQTRKPALAPRSHGTWVK